MCAVKPPYDIAALRAGIPLLGSLIPMCNCSQAPQTLAAREAAERYLDSWNQRGMDWDAWMEEVGRAKAMFARIINASPDDIAVFSSVSEAASSLASAIDFSGTRRKVVVTEAEFPTIGHVWLAQERRGARVAWVPVVDGAIDLAAYDAVIDDKTAVVSACHAYYLNGAVQDIAGIAARAHAHGALLFVDAYQSAGAMPIDVQAMDVDFLACGNLKYLMGIPGIAFMYVRRERVGALHPAVTGWFGRANPFAFQVTSLDWAPGASRFDAGTPPMINAYVARVGMEMIASVGVDNIRMWHQILAQRLIDGGRARRLQLHGSDDIARKTANTAFVVSDSHAIEQAMRARGVLPSARGPVIRLAPHFYNTTADVDAALDVLAEVTEA
jgi:selenocysteine lyase/cysteine desulfurase